MLSWNFGNKISTNTKPRKPNISVSQTVQEFPTFIESNWPVDKSQTLVLELSQIQPVHSLQSHFCNTYFNIIFLSTNICSKLSRLFATYKLWREHSLLLYCATCKTRLSSLSSTCSNSVHEQSILYRVSYQGIAHHRVDDIFAGWWPVMLPDLQCAVKLSPAWW